MLSAAAGANPEPEITEAGRSLLSSYRFHREDDQGRTQDYKLGEIIKASLANEEGKSIARLVCRNLLEAVSRHEVSAYDYSYLMAALFEVQTIGLLDEPLLWGAKSRNKLAAD